jgi:hypothetical protein
MSADGPEPVPAPSPAAQRMRLHRKRKRVGMQQVRIALHPTEVDMLVQTGFLAGLDFPRPCIIGYGSPSRCGPGRHCCLWSDAGSPSFRRAPSARDVLFDPGRVTAPRVSVLLMLRSTIRTVSAPSDKSISWLNHTPHAAAVHASCSTSRPPHATLASGRLATPYSGWTFTS